MVLSLAQYAPYIEGWRPGLGEKHRAFSEAHRMFGAAERGEHWSATLPYVEGRRRMIVAHPIHGEVMTMPVTPYDKDAIHESLRGIRSGTTHPEMVDPRLLMSTQSGLSHKAMKHYMSEDSPYDVRGETYADQGNIGNRHPVIYQNEDVGARFIMSGHHRATTALLRGKPLRAVVVRGGSGAWGADVAHRWAQSWR